MALPYRGVAYHHCLRLTQKEMLCLFLTTLVVNFFIHFQLINVCSDNYGT